MRVQRLSGFTLIELIISMVIVSIALLGVYSLLAQIVKLEKDVTLKTVSHNGLASLVEHVADSVKYSVTFQDQSGVMLTSDANGLRVLECRTVGIGYRTGNMRQSGGVLRRFTWGFPASSELSGTVQYQEIGFAGSAPITLAPELAQEQDLAVVWPYISSVTIARGLSSFSILVRQADDPDAPFLSSFSGSGQDGLFQIRAQMGGETVEKYQH